MARDLSVALAVPMHFDAIQGNLGHPDALVGAMRTHHPGGSVWVPGIGAWFCSWPARDASWHAGAT